MTRTLPSRRRSSSTHTSSMSQSKASSEFLPESRTRFSPRFPTTHSPQRSSTSFPRPASIHWPSQSEPATVHSSSLPSSARETLTASSFRHRSASISSRKSRRSFPDSPLSSTVHHLFRRNTSRSSTRTAESSRTASVSPRSSSEKPPRAQSARSTSTPTEDLP